MQIRGENKQNPHAFTGFSKCHGNRNATETVPLAIYKISIVLTFNRITRKFPMIVSYRTFRRQGQTVTDVKISILRTLSCNPLNIWYVLELPLITSSRICHWVEILLYWLDICVLEAVLRRNLTHPVDRLPVRHCKALLFCGALPTWPLAALFSPRNWLLFIALASEAHIYNQRPAYEFDWNVVYYEC